MEKLRHRTGRKLPKKVERSLGRVGTGEVVEMNKEEIPSLANGAEQV